MTPNEIKKLERVALSLNLITVEDMQCYTISQLTIMIANKVNELIGDVGRFESEVVDTVNTQNENIKYLLDKGLHQEILKIFDEWMTNGTFDMLINQTALKTVNDRIDETNAHLSTISDKFATTFDNEEVIKNGGFIHSLYFDLNSVIKKPDVNEISIMNENFIFSTTEGNFTFNAIETDKQWSQGIITWDINEYGLYLKPSVVGQQVERGYQSNLTMKTGNFKVSCGFMELTPQYSSVRSGLLKDENNFILINCDYLSGTLKFELLIKKDGVLNTIGLTPSRNIEKWFSDENITKQKNINMYLFNNVIVCTIEFDKREVLLGEHKLTTLDLTFTENLKAFKPSFGARLNQSSELSMGIDSKLTIKSFDVSYTGGINVGADYKVITYEDNKPIQNGNKIFITSTTHMTNDISGNGCNVYEVDLHSYSVKLVGKVAFAFNGLICNLGSVKIIYDRTCKKWVVVGTNFNVNPVLTYIGETTDNLTSGVHVIDGRLMTIPDYSQGTWDIDIIKNNGRYEVLYTLNGTPRKIVKAVSDDLMTWREVQRVNTTTYGEGCVITVIGGVKYFTHVSNKKELDIYDYDTMTKVKVIPMSYTPGSDITPDTPMPWGCILSLTSHHKSRYYLLMFDMEKVFSMNYGYGNMLIYGCDAYYDKKDYLLVEQEYLN